MNLSSVFKEDLFKEKVAIVTGGGTGIGLTITEELLRGGAQVVIASRNMKRLIPAAKGLSRDYNTEVTPISCNIRELEEVESLYDKVLDKFGKVDFLVNNGGGQFLAPAKNISEKGWKGVIDTNLNGTWNMCISAARKWMLDHGGRIVNIIAHMWNGYPSLAHTGAARAGVANLTKSLAVEWSRSDILINCVAPGGIVSTGFHNYTPEQLDYFWRQIPLKRFGRSEDVAHAVAYLLSPAGNYITGESIRVDGAGSLWGANHPIPDPEKSPEFDIPPLPEQRWPEFVIKEDE
ncbi:MAG: SDR family oxidoreductase [Desulfobacterales bacterium]|jgi:peroxisomal trans-2-enoyl-CoA reductase|nr:SDR family oxidoreductase [Desulfobacteraceae bacterium]MBT7695907.1 SDR family oxidoreductase [Desulfobacterales bacterium]